MKSLVFRRVHNILTGWARRRIFSGCKLQPHTRLGAEVFCGRSMAAHSMIVVSMYSGGFMHRAQLIAVLAVITFGLVTGCAMPVSEQSVTAYERARLIVGDGRVVRRRGFPPE